VTDEELYRLHKLNYPDWEPPTLIEKAGSAIVAAGTAIKQAIAGDSPFVSQPEQTRRIAICGGCSKYDQKWERCTACSCFVNLKTILKSQSCPVGKW
jgi:hypothetical protein